MRISSGKYIFYRELQIMYIDKGNECSKTTESVPSGEPKEEDLESARQEKPSSRISFARIMEDQVEESH
jgi:hypothetical protein